jgi:hypothetical protein
LQTLARAPPLYSWFVRIPITIYRCRIACHCGLQSKVSYTIIGYVYLA